MATGQCAPGFLTSLSCGTLICACIYIIYNITNKVKCASFKGRFVTWVAKNLKEDWFIMLW